MKLLCLNLWRTGASFSALLWATSAFAQSEAAVAARRWRESHELPIVQEFSKLLEIPNIARDLPNIRRNAALLREMLERRGVKTQLLEVPDVPPVVFGEIVTPGAKKTLVFYAHYDGQPVEPKDWTGGAPFKPILRTAALEAGGKDIPLPQAGQLFNPEWRLYSRSTGDDKGAIIAQLTALDALRAAGVKLNSNIKFFYEGEEEAGSAHVDAILRKYKNLLGADLWLFCDGPVHQNRQQQVVFGARGTMGLNLTVYGPRRELHSGHYGNWAINPAWTLTHLLTSMKDIEGKVLVQDFYKGAQSYGALEKKAIAEGPSFERELKDELWLNTTEGGDRIEERIGLPSLNIRGLESAGVGPQSRNVIPITATASIDIRLVKGMDHKVTAGRVIEHIRRQGFYVVTDHEPTEQERKTHSRVARVTISDGYNASRIAMDHPLALKVVKVIEAARGKVVRLPMSGGSVPMSIFESILGAPLIMIPIANHDNNQHSHNENMRIRNLWDGIETMAALLAME